MVVTASFCQRRKFLKRLEIIRQIPVNDDGIGIINSEQTN